MQIDEAQVEIKMEANGRQYHFVCDRNSPLGEIHDVLFEMKKHIIQAMEKLERPSELGEDNEHKQ